ncbi:hypothetical protein [Halogranum rubrum]|uniref:Uncharacterized protein n=1 Tax=Halogranum salarium B-1 TaxID=1210908 RepID=J2ZCT5_9EURY|nr:hypothetical protein [Halogranum salarium]EJN58485.1 hypothetical protein HSB1_29630 [Halogranum salarium B-1]
MAFEWNLSDDHLDTGDVDERFDYYSTTIDDWFETTDDDVRGFGGDGPEFDVDGKSEQSPIYLPDSRHSDQTAPRVRRTYEEGVEIYPGRRSVWRVPHPELFEDATERAFYLLYFPIDIYPFKNDRRYTRVEFGIELDESGDVDAMDLCPQDVYGSEQVTQKYTLQPSLKFAEVQASVGSAEWQTTYTQLHPTVTMFGPGKSKFGWVFSTGTGESVLPGARHNWILLNAPADCETLDGTYYSDVVYTEKKYGYYWKKTASADRPFSVALTDAEALSERWWTNAGN